MLRFVVICALVALVAVNSVDAEILKVFVPCSGRRFGQATISQVRVTPCPETNRRRPCLLRKNTNATIEVDFTPNAAVQTVQARALSAGRFVDLPLVGMNTNACEFMPCPLQAGVPVTYSYALNINRNFPAQRYDVKWQFTGKGFNFCVKFPIEVVN